MEIGLRWLEDGFRKRKCERIKREDSCGARHKRRSERERGGRNASRDAPRVREETGTPCETLQEWERQEERGELGFLPTSPPRGCVCKDPTCGG